MTPALSSLALFTRKVNQTSFLIKFSSKDVLHSETDDDGGEERGEDNHGAREEVFRAKPDDVAEDEEPVRGQIRAPHVGLFLRGRSVRGYELR